MAGVQVRLDVPGLEAKVRARNSVGGAFCCPGNAGCLQNENSDRQDTSSQGEEGGDQQRLLELVPIDYVAVGKRTVIAFLCVLNHKRALSNVYNLPHELVGNIMQFLCQTKCRKIILSGDYDASI